MVKKSKTVYIFGAGISGCTLARKLADANYKVNLYEKNKFVGGNCYDFNDKNKVLIHKFGPHIFHTSDKKVVNFINKFTKLNSFKNEVLSNVDNKLIPLPINFDSIKLIDPKNAQYIIKKLKKEFPNKKTITFFEFRNVKDSKVKQMSDYIFKNMYANYSSKMWGTKFENISPDTINRVKICLSYNRSYFPDDKYQGLPVKGYTNMINKIINHKNINLVLNSKQKLSLKNNKTYIDNKQTNDPIFYCGSIDELFSFKYGILPYRSLDIKFESFNKNSYQENAVINYPADKAMTRIAEYKKMTLQKLSKATTISKEFPGQFSPKSKKFGVRYYPIKNDKNIATYNKYAEELRKFKNIHSLGRLAEYKYYDMDEAIASALAIFERLFN